MVWHSLPFEERERWQKRARKALAEHKKRYPGYSFRPGKGEGKGEGKKSKDVKEVKEEEEVMFAVTEAGASPASTTQSTKRKHRETGPRDVARCEQIARLLSLGFRGSELEEAIGQFDREREPVPVVPRFEEVITARQYEGNGETAKEKARSASPADKSRTKKAKTTQDSATTPTQPAPLHTIRRSSSLPLLDTFTPTSSSFPSSATNAPSSSYYSPESYQNQYSVPHPDQSNFDASPLNLAHRKRSASSSPPPLRHHHNSYQTYHHTPAYAQGVDQSSSFDVSSQNQGFWNANFDFGSSAPPSTATTITPQQWEHPTAASTSGGENTFFEYDSHFVSIVSLIYPRPRAPPRRWG